MTGVLLDTNALIWLLAGEPLSEAALLAIAQAQEDERLFVSPVSAWEAAVAARKPNEGRRPDLGGRDAKSWFREAKRQTGAQLVRIGQRIALEAAAVPAVYRKGDPGDCFLIASARVRRLAIVTRDQAMIRLGDERPDYLWAIEC